MVESRQPEALAIIVIFPILAGVFVAGRICSRQLGKNYGWDDWLILLSSLLLLGQTVTMYKFIVYSRTGFHSYDLPPQTVSEQVLASKWSFAVQLFYHPLMGAIRASIIMFLFRVQDRRAMIRNALHVVFWINIGYMVSTTFVNIFQCTPVRYAYLRAAMDQKDTDGNVIKAGKCINSLAFIMSSCGLSIFMDLIIIPIPTAMVWNLHMRTKTKIAVVVIMSMGWIATAVSVGRFVIYYYRFSPSNKDRTWSIGLVISIVEPSVGVIAACAPAMKCLFRRLVPRYFSDDGTTNPNHTRTISKSTLPRQSLSYHFGLDKEMGDANYVAMANGRIVAVGGNEPMYGMRPLGSMDSRERMVNPVPHAAPTRTRSTNTMRTRHSDLEQAVPEFSEHILSHK